MILSFILFFLIGALTVFCSCSMMRRVFRHKLRRGYILFSLLCGLPTLCYAVTVRLAAGENASVDLSLMAAFYVPMIWLCMTDRSFRSLAASLSGYVFAACTSMVMSRLISLAEKYLQSESDEQWVSFVLIVIGDAAAAGFVLFICRIAGSRLTEPMSIWNVMFIALLAFFTIAVTDRTEVTADTMNVVSVLYPLISLALLSVAVVMTVKLTESRYYSTLNSINESYLTSQKNYYEIKQTSDTEIRRIKHDMKNHLICIRQLAAQGKYDELESYIGEITETVNEADRLIHTGSGIIDAIVNEKAAEARKAGVRFEWEGTVSGLDISAVDSCTLVSNLLDNALEACDKVDVAKRFISLSFRRSEHFLLMTCENSASRVIELSDGRPLSSKSDRTNHGFGLENIERCVGKYGGHLDLSSTLEESGPVFKAEAVIPLRQ